MNESSKTNWERLDQMTDEDIDTADSPALGDSFFAQAAVRIPQGKTIVALSVDEDVLAWFRAQGPEYQKRMTAALRIYAEAHQSAA